MACVLGPSKDPCTATILPTLLGFGGIHNTILSYMVAGGVGVYVSGPYGLCVRPI